MSFDEIEANREFNEALEYEEYLAASSRRYSRPCPACGMPMEDPDLICCMDCAEEAR